MIPAGALLDVCFDCPACGTQLEAAVSLDTPTVRCDHHGCTPESCAGEEEAFWHAVQPVTCEGCGKQYSIVELNESAAVHQAVMDAEVNEVTNGR